MLTTDVFLWIGGAFVHISKQQRFTKHHPWVFPPLDQKGL